MMTSAPTLAEREHAIELGLAGRLDEAEAILRRHLQANPTNGRTAGNLGLVLMAQGRYREAAPLYEARLYSKTAPPDPGLPFPRWSGEPLDGKRVLIWPEEGFGDQIMQARFAELLQQRGCDVTLVCHPDLARLFAASLSVRVCAARGAISFPDPDVWLWSNSLPGAVAATPDTLPSEPYLRASEARATPYRLGVAVSGNPAHTNDANRSLPPAQAEELWSLPGAKSLAREHIGAADMAETAAIIASLDLIVTVDTAVAHLAGAMGKPTWILLPDYGTDWRWMRGRADSPWYPCARLFRQPRPGDWASVLAAVKAALP